MQTLGQYPHKRMRRMRHDGFSRDLMRENVLNSRQIPHLSRVRAGRHKHRRRCQIHAGRAAQDAGPAAQGCRTVRQAGHTGDGDIPGGRSASEKSGCV